MAERINLSWALALLVLALFAGACREKVDVNNQVAELEKAFPAAVSGPGQAASGTGRPAAVPPDANAYVKLALTAVQTNDYAASVIALQAAQRVPGVTAPQMMAIENAKQVMSADLQARAARGDAKAKADLAAIEKTLSQ